MRTHTRLLVLLAVALGGAACGADSEPEVSSDATSSPTTTSVDTTTTAFASPTTAGEGAEAVSATFIHLQDVLEGEPPVFDLWAESSNVVAPIAQGVAFGDAVEVELPARDGIASVYLTEAGAQPDPDDDSSFLSNGLAYGPAPVIVAANVRGGPVGSEPVATFYVSAGVREDQVDTRDGPVGTGEGVLRLVANGFDDWWPVDASGYGRDIVIDGVCVVNENPDVEDDVTYGGTAVSAGVHKLTIQQRPCGGVVYAELEVDVPAGGVVAVFGSAMAQDRIRLLPVTFERDDLIPAGH